MSEHRDPTDHVEELRDIPDEELIEPVVTVRRRMIIRYMARLSPDVAVSTRELAEVIMALEEDIPFRNAMGRQCRSIRRTIQQSDVVKLSIAGVLDKHDNNTIYRGERFEFYAGVIDAIDEYAASHNG